MLTIFAAAKYKLLGLLIQLNRSKVEKLKAIPHTSGYSHAEADRRIELLDYKYSKLIAGRSKIILNHWEKLL